MATFETASQAAESGLFHNYPSGANINPVSTNNHDGGGTDSELLTGGYTSQVGVAKSYPVFPGDSLKIEAYARYDAPTGTSSNLAAFASVLISAFGLPGYTSGETGNATAALNSWGSIAAGGYGDGSTDNTDVKAFVNIIIFDKNYNLLDVAYSQVTSTGTPGYIVAKYKVKEAGYAFMYISNENAYVANAYFDDVKMSYTPSQVLQYSEYYPFGLQTAGSWTRSGATPNNFLGNGGTELNTTSNLYDLDFRNYDPALARMHQVDLMADKYSSMTPYHFALNNPVGAADPSGLDPDPPIGSIAYGTYSPGPHGNDQTRPEGGGGIIGDGSDEAKLQALLNNVTSDSSAPITDPTFGGMLTPQQASAFGLYSGFGPVSYSILGAYNSETNQDGADGDDPDPSAGPGPFMIGLGFSFRSNAWSAMIGASISNYQNTWLANFNLNINFTNNNALNLNLNIVNASSEYLRATIGYGTSPDDSVGLSAQLTQSPGGTIPQGVYGDGLTNTINQINNAFSVMGDITGNNPPPMNFEPYINPANVTLNQHLFNVINP